MTGLPWWKRSMMGLAAIVAAHAAMAEPPRLGTATPEAEPTQTPKFQYAGSGSCKLCHGLTREQAEQGPYKSSVDFIKLNESKTWETEDKHSVAYKQLLVLDGRAQRMGRLMKVDVTQPSAGCLGCHSASTAELQERVGDQFDRTEGVSCENCHGPLSAYSYPHTQVSFRTKSTEEWAKVGFVDLRSPERQAEKCLTCHVGNVAEGKLLTHEMYASGHPPLPSIEVATFANLIPRHWWLNSERKDLKLRQALGYEEGQKEQVKMALVGAAVALKVSMKLLADEAGKLGSAPVPGQVWPDYARFDCWSCHHDLKRDGWRQTKGSEELPPGRVPVAEWPLTLVELGIEHLAQSDPAAAALRSDLDRYRKALGEQVAARPFGRPSSVARAADDFAAWADVLTRKLAASKVDRTTASRLLRRLLETASRSTPDYDSARHVGWTVVLLVKEVGTSLDDRPQIRAILDRLTKGLKLDLPAGRAYEIEGQIADAFRVIGDYEPAEFTAQLQALLALLPPA